MSTPPIDHLSAQLQQLRFEYELILGAAGEGIYGIDNQGRARFANDASARILGWHPEEIMGKLLHDLHHHSHVDGSPYPLLQCPIYAALQDGEVHRIDNEVFWHRDGSAVPVEYISTPIIKEGEIQGAVIVFRDISERLALEKQREADFEEIRNLKEALEQERDYLRQEIKINTRFGEIIGESPALQRTLAQIEAVAETPTSVLILGESGVGKEMIARAIHERSPRKEAALVKVNCASIPKDLFESEFFGHVKGAFTGAHRDRVGRLQLANGGTLFLDEVGEIPLDLQGKLLRALQEQEFERIGDERTTKVDVRIVAATNRDLLEEVKAGHFREDLYYRLSVFPIFVPPLRQRRADIAPLAQHFICHSCRDLGRETIRLSKQQGDLLAEQVWRGNIRELKNVIERAVILTKGKKLRLDLAMQNTTTADFSDSIVEDNDPLLNHSTRDGLVLEEAADVKQFYTESEFRQLEKQNLINALEACHWKIAGKEGAAIKLGLKPPTLSYRMDNFGIKNPKRS